MIMVVIIKMMNDSILHYNLSTPISYQIIIPVRTCTAICHHVDVSINIADLPSTAGTTLKTSLSRTKIKETLTLHSKGTSGVVWCGVVWCGVVWCGVVWCGVVWCGVVWCDVV